jgi:hypothetical protein
MSLALHPSQATDPAPEKDKQDEQEKEKKDEEPIPVDHEDQVSVAARADDFVGIAESATEGVTGQQDLQDRPKLRPGELVETVPGMIATQHSGGGKANQYFLRGFNLDHGTDFRTTVDGMQVNFATHGHGQGYTDLNFVIPELVSTARFRKGPYYAGVGDFAAAGSIDFELVDELEHSIAEVTGGSHDFGRILAAGSESLAEGTLLGGLEIVHSDGPWERPDDYWRGNGILRWNRGDRGSGTTLTFLAHDGSWNATDQIPRRAVEEGLVGRFGSLDPDLEGSTARYSLSGQWRRSSENRFTRLTAYAMRYDFELLSNFTYFLDDPVNGDEILQQDDRWALGARFDREGAGRWGARPVTWLWGTEARGDFIDNGLFHTRAGVVTSDVRQDEIRQVEAGAFGEARVRWNEWLRTTAGLRVDGFDAHVGSDLAENSGSRSQALWSPKLNLTLGPWAETEYYLNLGYGHHSNDARGTTIRVDPATGDPAERVDPLVRAKGADVGVRTTVVRTLQTTVSAFVLELDSELVFVGDAGVTEAGRPSRRTGIELANYWRPKRWLAFDLDGALTRGRFTDHDPAGDRIPGSLESAVSAGATVPDLHGYFGSLRWRYFGPRPLIEDDSVRSGSTSLVNLRFGRRFKSTWSAAVEIFNLLGSDDSDIEYFYASRLAGEPAEGIEDVHFHPVEDRTVRLVVGTSF